MDEITRKLREDPAFAEGRAAAEAEIPAGQIGYRICGKVVWSVCDEATMVLQDRFGIKLQVYGFCITPIDMAAKAEGYNERMKEEISAHFGHDVIGAVFREIERKQKKSKRRSRGR
jgi:hypothetical protein